MAWFGPGVCAAGALAASATNSAGVTRAPAKRAPEDAFALRRFEWIPPFVTPRTIAARFPRDNPAATVEALTFAGGRLWAVIRPRGGVNLPPGAGRLWSYGESSGLLEPIHGPLAAHSVNTLFGRTNELWLGLNGGLVALDLERTAIQPYGPGQGVISTNIVGIGAVGDITVALGRHGLLWGKPPGMTNFIRAAGMPPADNPRSPAPWQFFTASGDWMLAASPSAVAVRHFRGTQWLALQDELVDAAPRLTPPQFTCVEGDGEGGFWLGSNAGLHFANPEGNVVENRFTPLSVTVSGGLGMSVAAGMQPTATAYAMARDRVMSGVRERMRDRARYARTNSTRPHPVNPVWPASRLPGGVTALHHDGKFLWVATTDGMNPLRARVLLLHQATRRWVGWFPVGFPVRAIAADAQRLWLGLDTQRTPDGSPLMVVDRLPLISVPQTKWTRDAITPEELGTKLAALPVQERAVLAFFGGDSQRVLELLAPDGEAAPTATAEALFLLAFLHDGIGLNQPERLDHFATRLRAEHPDSLFAELTGAVRGARPVPLPAEPAVPVVEPVTEPVPVDIPPASAPPVREPALAASAAPPQAVVLALLKRRDLDQDGTLNPGEFRMWRGQDADFAAADLNHDGMIDADEVAQLLTVGAPPTEPAPAEPEAVPEPKP